jgi:hypothetical protein
MRSIGLYDRITARAMAKPYAWITRRLDIAQPRHPYPGKGLNE